MDQIFKYPRTLHVEGSRKQKGDEDRDAIPYSTLAGKHLVVEEKMDGANSAISFSENGELRLQSRGHYLTGGPRERHFDLLKSWAAVKAPELWPILGDRYIMYGEWMYAKHTTFYNDLPHYFLEFDILDTETSTFLSTEKRREKLKDAPFIVPVKVLYEGTLKQPSDLADMISDSHFIVGEPDEDLRRIAEEKGLDPEQILKETDLSCLMEGLYIKVEENGIVTERLKYVRAGFLQTLLESKSHWMNRPIIPNQLNPKIDIFA